MSAIPTITRREVRQYTQDEREQIVELVLEHIANGRSVSSVCEQLGVDDATVMHWVRSDLGLESRYEELKIIRSRVLVERALQALETLGNEGVSPKCVDIAVRHRMRIAALLNPKEFSERMLSNPKAGLGNQRVTFALNFAGAPPPDGQVTITYDPNEHEE